MTRAFFAATGLALLATSAFAAPPHDAMPMMAEPVATKPEASNSRAEFAGRYAAAERPRIAVYYNRELSGKLEEWITPSRQRSTNASYYGSTYQGESYTQLRDFNESERAQPDERWSWAFEDGFYTTLLNEKVRLIDRTTILRLAANERPETTNNDKGDGTFQTIPLKRVEIEALKQHADLIIEVLVAQAGEPGQYVFKAKVMEVRTGRLLAVVNQVPAPGSGGKAAFVAGPNGFERDHKTVATDDARAKGERLADEVMGRLARIWQP